MGGRACLDERDSSNTNGEVLRRQQPPSLREHSRSPRHTPLHSTVTVRPDVNIVTCMQGPLLRESVTARSQMTTGVSTLEHEQTTAMAAIATQVIHYPSAQVRQVPTYLVSQD